MGVVPENTPRLDAAIARSRSCGALGRALGMWADRTPACLNCPHFLQKVGQVLEENGCIEEAVVVYRELVNHAQVVNRPLAALLAIQHLKNLDHPTRELVYKLASNYSLSSNNVMPGTVPKRTGCLITGELDALVDDDAPDPLSQGVRTGCSLESEVEIELEEGIGYSPIPVLSELESDDFARLVDTLELNRWQPGEILVQAGDNWPGIWWLDQGEFSVTSSDQRTELVEGVHLVLGLECLYGMPCEVTIASRTSNQALFLSASRLVELLRGSPTTGSVFQRIYHRGEIHRAIACCPLFVDLSREDHIAIISVASGHHIPKGTPLVTQGRPSPGLYLVVRGEIQLQVDQDEETRSITRLGAGDVTGLLGLGPRELSPLSAVAHSDVYVLFLDGADLRRVFYGHPAVEGALQRLQRERASQVLQAVSG